MSIKTLRKTDSRNASISLERTVMRFMNIVERKPELKSKKRKT